MRLDHLLSNGRKVRVLGTVESYIRKVQRFPVSMRPWETPVPIPNTTVKTQTADGTMLETAWESRWMPELVFTSDQRVQGLNSLMADKISVSHVP